MKICVAIRVQYTKFKNPLLNCKYRLWKPKPPQSHIQGDTEPLGGDKPWKKAPLVEWSRQLWKTSTIRYEPCHEKMYLKIFVIVVPKEGLADLASPILLVVWHRLQNVISEDNRVKCYSRCHTQRRICEAPPPNPSFGMTTKLILVLYWTFDIDKLSHINLFTVKIIVVLLR